jgi:hypothetical protein
LPTNADSAGPDANARSAADVDGDADYVALAIIAQRGGVPVYP